MGGDEILQHGKTFTEVRSNRTFDNLTGRLGHQSTHTRELLDLVLVTSGSGINHHEEWICLFLAFVELEFAVKGVGDVVTGTGPNIDDFLVALAVGDHTIAILLVDGLDIGVSGLEFSRLFFRNHHVDDTNGATGTGRFLEAEFLELVHGSNGGFTSGNLVATPNDVSDLGLADVVVEEANAVRPDLVEADTSRSGLDDVLLLVAKDRILAKIGVTQADILVVIQLPVGNREFNLGGILEERQVTLFLDFLWSANLGPCEVIRS